MRQLSTVSLLALAIAYCASLFSLVTITVFVVLSGLDVVVMGSNIGIETSFFALTFPDVQVYGYDLLCAFVGRAKELQVRDCAWLHRCIESFGKRHDCRDRRVLRFI